MAIKYKCKKCSKLIVFPETPNFETSREEQIAHMIYTQCANSGTCYDCDESKHKQGDNLK